MNDIRVLNRAVIKASVKARNVLRSHEILFLTAKEKAQMMMEMQNGKKEPQLNEPVPGGEAGIGITASSA